MKNRIEKGRKIPAGSCGGENESEPLEKGHSSVVPRLRQYRNLSISPIHRSHSQKQIHFIFN